MSHMKKLLLALLVAAAACSESTAPSDDLVALDESAILGFSASSAREPGSRYLGNLHRLPANLALTDAQKTKIDGLIAAFELHPFDATAPMCSRAGAR